MSHRSVGAALAGILAAVSFGASAAADELSELRAQLEIIQKRLAELEKKQAETAAIQERVIGAAAQARSSAGEWVGRFQWKGDFRFRNETIDQELVSGARNRDRIRLRAGFIARVNDTIKTEVQLTTTEGGNPRGSNQTLTGVSSRKAVGLDLAYAEWAPASMWKLTLGKQKYPWVRPGQSLFFDNDVNPEGIAWNFSRGGLFGALWYTDLAERSTAADSIMTGGQLGYRWDLSGTDRLTLGVSYFDHGAVQGYNPFFNDDPAGNTAVFVTQDSAGVSGNRDLCRAVVATPARPPAGIATSSTRCLVSDYDVMELLVEYSTALAGRPLTLFADYAMNQGAEDYPATAQIDESELDTAWSFGVAYGKASNPRSWEIGLGWQKLEKDSLFGQWIDSTFGGGNTDAEGFVLRLGYAFNRNFTFNGAYYLNDTHNELPASGVVGAAGRTCNGVALAPAQLCDRRYERLQFDVNFKF